MFLLNMVPLSRTAARSLFEVLPAVRQLILEQHLPTIHLKVCHMLDEVLLLSDNIDAIAAHLSHKSRS